MQLRGALAALLASALAGAARASRADPLGTVLDLLTELQGKIQSDADAEEKAYGSYVEWCDETTKNQQYEIKTATTKKGKLEATISKATADIEAAVGKVDDLASKVAAADKDLKDATAIREKENADFTAEEATLMETVDALTRAVGIIEKEMSKNPAAFVQADTVSITNLIGALSTITDAAGLDAATSQRLAAFVQQQASAEEEDGAPNPSSYKSHSTGILDVLEDLKAKAEDELAALRKAESNANHNYKMLKQSLEDEAGYNTKEKAEEEAFKADTEETKATAKGDLAKTVALLDETTEALKVTQEDCMHLAADHDASVEGRAEELKVLEEAKKVITETSSGAVEQTYDFLQVTLRSRLKTRTDLKSVEIVRFMKKLAKDRHSQALAQLASRVAALMQFGARNGEDPFVKVKGLIKDMITKLESQAQAAATEKAYCDEQMAKTEAKKSELEDDVAKLTAKIDTKSAMSASLKEDVVELQEELSALAKEQADMGKVRGELHAAFLEAQASLKLGLQGVTKALSVLRKYYQGKDAASMLQTDDDQPSKPVFHSKASGAGGSIIDILEVVESDFAKELSSIETEEGDQVAAFEKRTQEIKEANALKSKDVEYKAQEFKSLDKEVNELTGDRSATDEELSAVLEYFAKVKERCVAKPETYEERKARRESEIEGLKDALRILSDETAPSLMQAKTRKLRSTQGFLDAR